MKTIKTLPHNSNLIKVFIMGVDVDFGFDEELEVYADVEAYEPFAGLRDLYAEQYPTIYKPVPHRKGRVRLDWDNLNDLKDLGDQAVYMENAHIQWED